MKTKEKNENSFFYKYRNNSKYKAKVQLLVGFIFIFIMVIYVNITAGNDHNISSQNTVKGTNTVEISNFLNKLHDKNYSYELDIVKKNEEQEINYKYIGNIYNDSQKVKKVTPEGEAEYFIKGDNYYKLNKNKYELINGNEVYNLLTYSFLDIKNIMNYINNGIIDHKTEYNDSTVETYYNVPLSKITLNGNEEDYVIIIVKENKLSNTISFDIDYSAYYNLYDVEKVKSLSVKYNITSIGEIKEFKNIDLHF